MAENYTILERASIIGDSGVGKSWLCSQLFEMESLPMSPTIGSECHVCKFYDQNSRLHFLQLWEWSPMIFQPSFLRGSSGVLIVFDLTKTNSFKEAVEKWVESVNSVVSDTDKVILVGNKCDCEDEREVSLDRIRIVCDKMELTYVEVSAKDKVNTALLLNKLVGISKHCIVYKK